MKRAFQRPYLWWTISIFLVYLLLNIVLSNFTTTLLTIPYYLATINWPLLLSSLSLTILIAGLVAVNMVYSYIRTQERANKKAVAVTCSASVAGLLVGVCPFCTASILPLMLSAIGVTFSWLSLPFQGLEVQLGIIMLLAINLEVLRK